MIDLTYPIENEMPKFHAYWHPDVSIKSLGHHQKEGRSTLRLIVGSHTGTHIDAPLHFIEHGKSVDNIPLDRLIGPVTVIHLTHLHKNDPLQIEHIHHVSLKTKKLIFHFGWGKYWKTDSFYMDYPFFSKEVAQYLISKGIDFIGMDTPSPDDSRIIINKETIGSDQDSPIHKLFLSNDIIIAEYLANLDTIPEKKDWQVIAMPLKIKDADGAPARICIY